MAAIPPVAQGAADCLLKKVLTHREFDSHVTEITFPAPVVVTAARCGAVPSSAAGHQQTLLLLFAQDAGAPASARFLQLCPGFEQPQSGTRVVQLQPCATTRVLLRGWYQTVPLSLYGYPLETAMSASPPLPQRRLTLAAALQWLQRQQQRELVVAQANAACWRHAPLQPAVAAVLSQLVAYWEVVGTSERLMALTPPPTTLFETAATVADSVCAQLVAGKFGLEPVPLAAAPESQQQPPQQQQAKEPDGGHAAMADAAESDAAGKDVEGQLQPAVAAAASSTTVAAASQHSDNLLDAAADLVLGWCGMLGAGAAGRTSAAVRCSMVGLAAAVLLCSCGTGARRMVARWGVVLLDDVMTMPAAPPSFIRYSATACLLITRCCGTLGAAALLGLWRPRHGIVWQLSPPSPEQQQLAALACAVTTQVTGTELVAPAGEADLEQHPYSSHSEGEDAEGHGQGARHTGQQGAAEQHDLLHQQWQQEQRQREGEELLYGDSGSDSGNGGGRGFEENADGVPHELGGCAAGQAEQQPAEYVQEIAVAGTIEHPNDSLHQEQTDMEAAALAQAADMEAEEFGGDVYADAATQQQQEHVDIVQLSAAPEAQPLPASQPGPASNSEEDDLYGGLDLGLGATIPQIDGAADSPPRRRHSRGADPDERWEMGGADGKDGKECKRRRKDRDERSTERDAKRRKDKDNRLDNKQSRERRGRWSRGTEHGGRIDDVGHIIDREPEWALGRAERQRHKAEEEQRQRDAVKRRRRRQEADDQLRRRRQQEEEERWRQQLEDDEQRRRYQEQQRRLEQDQRQLEQVEQQRQQQRGEEKRRLEQQREKEKRQFEQRQQEEEQRRQKRERFPLAEPNMRVRQHMEPEGMQTRTNQGPSREQPARELSRAERSAMAGPTPPGPSQEQQQRMRQQNAGAAAPLDEAEKWDLYEQQQRWRMMNYWHLKESAYGGCAQHMARHLLEDVQPQRLTLVVRQLLHLLRAHEAAATFESAAEKLVTAHQRQRPPASPEISLLVADCCSSLQQLAKLLAKPLPLSNTNNGRRGLHPATVDPPSSLFEAISSRRLLSLLAAVLHVPMAHRSVLEKQQLPTPSAAAQQAVVVEEALQQQLAAGAKSLLAVLASSRNGWHMLLSDAAVLEQLLLAIDPGCLAAECPNEGASMLQHLLIAEAAVVQLCSSNLETEAAEVAAETAASLLHDCGASGRRALVQVLALQSEVAVPRLLLMLHLHCTLLRAASSTTASGTIGLDGSTAALQQQDGLDFDLLLASASACMHAPQLVLALATATHANLLGCWQQHAVALQLAASTELSELEALQADATASVAGLGATKSALASLKGATAAVLALQQQCSISALFTYLGAELPAFGVPPAVATAEEDSGSGVQAPAGTVCTVHWTAVEALFCDPEKLACCEQRLRLLASMLWSPSSAGRATAYAADTEGALFVLLRAVLTGAELAEASAADSSWQVLAGHSIDVGEAAACRRRALSFLASAAAAMSCLLQHLRGSSCPVKSNSLLVGLLRAHAALCCQEESLACMLGSTEGEGGAGPASQAGTTGMEAALAARYHLASCLRCYVEAAQPWQPLLLQQVFWGTPAAGLETGQVTVQTPAEMFATACLLGDLFPAEWPTAGSKATQAPPSDRKYRAALATAIEPCRASFRHLIAAALTSESRLLRAAVVRVLARASGLGGGMGPFLVQPLLEELQTVAESPAPLHDGRRLLEVIVPLVYRPAIKSAMLAAPFTSTLAQMLGVMTGKLSSPDESSEALHVCTMAMEAVVVLFNHEVCLNPLASKEQRQLHDMPPVAEAVPMARALLELLPGMASIAMIAHHVLRLMAAAESGRQALRRAVVAVHAAATGVELPAGQLGAIAVAQAAQWVANRYWAAAERLGGADAAAAGAGELEHLRSVYADIISIMQQICVAADEVDSPGASSAQQRFVAALQASLQAAAAAGLDVGGDEQRWEGPCTAESGVLDLVHDPATRMFWRNVRARAATQSQASSAHAMRRFARREVQTDADASLEGSLHPTLTLPRQLTKVPVVDKPSQQQQQQQNQEAVAAPAGACFSPTPAAAHTPEQQQHGSPPVIAGAAIQAPAVKAEPVALQRLQSVPGQQSMDLYGDLSLQASGSRQLHTAGNVGAAASWQQQHHQQPPISQQHDDGQAAAQPSMQGRTAQVSAAIIPPQPNHAALDAPPAETARLPLDSTGSGSVQGLLSNPGALQALLKDPAQLQRLLEKHPTLISLLKSTLGKVPAK